MTPKFSYGFVSGRCIDNVIKLQETNFEPFFWQYGVISHVKILLICNLLKIWVLYIATIVGVCCISLNLLINERGADILCMLKDRANGCRARFCVLVTLKLAVWFYLILLWCQECKWSTSSIGLLYRKHIYQKKKWLSGRPL